MKVTIAMDSFKGSLTSLEAGYAVAEGIRRITGKAEISVRPLADGGEGTVEALVDGMQGRLRTVTVTGPLGQPVSAVYGVIEKTGTAVMEMSQAAGITLVPQELRNPLDTTTRGVGEMICDALRHGCRRFLIGIGGSATNDGGIGMLQALGYGFLDREGRQVADGAKGLRDLHQITREHALPELADCEFYIACDVTNPLCGAQGCSAVFAPQKGAAPELVEQMDAWMRSYAALAQEYAADADPQLSGSGAAGGLGFAFRTFLNGSLTSGVQLILRETGLEAYLREADVVVTGEGCLDGQTVMGKAPVGVAQLAKKYGKPVIAFAGAVSGDAASCNAAGIDAFFPILRTVTSLAEAMQPEQAKKNLADTAEQVFRLIEKYAKP